MEMLQVIDKYASSLSVSIEGVRSHSDGGIPPFPVQIMFEPIITIRRFGAPTPSPSLDRCLPAFLSTPAGGYIRKDIISSRIFASSALTVALAATARSVSASRSAPAVQSRLLLGSSPPTLQGCCFYTSDATRRLSCNSQLSLVDEGNSFPSRVPDQRPS